MPTPLGVPTALLSIYKNVAARQGGLKRFMRSVKDLDVPALYNAARVFARRHPRVAAHRLIRKGPSRMAEGLENVPVAANTYIPMRVEPMRGPIFTEYAPEGIAEAVASPTRAIETMVEEGVHAAQYAGNRHMGPMYAALNKLVGYYRNPFEVATDPVKDRALGVSRRIARPTNVMEAVRYIISKGNPKDPNIQLLREIVEQRTDRPMNLPRHHYPK
jgi:hypothetical protein